MRLLDDIFKHKLWKEWIQRDLIYLTLITLAIGGCLYTILYEGSCADKCEDFIKKEIGDIDCSNYAGYTDERISEIFINNWGVEEMEEERKNIG